MSQDEGAPLSSGVVGQIGNDLSQQLVRQVRRGRSFSGNERNCAFLNIGESRFVNVSAVSGFDFPDDSRAVGRVDWDDDGDLDLWITNRNGPQLRFLRNDQPTDNHWISLRLQGAVSNRDAIGARVEVFAGDVAKPIVRTLRSGDGYLTQSSKTIHIGLGATKTCSVNVAWPSGLTSSFANLQTNQHYRLVEKDPVAKPIERKRQNLKLANSNVSSQLKQNTAAVYSIIRPHLPQLRYEKNGSTVDLISEVKEPTLLVLWSSSCPACFQELSELTELQAQWEQRGLRVILLSVDHLASDTSENAKGPEAVLAKIGVPFDAGKATDSLVAKLQLVNDFMFILQEPFTVPMSFLIDENFRLAGIYRGKLDTERLIQDLDDLNKPTEIRRQRSVPFRGKWVGEPKTLPTELFVLELIQNGFLNEASELVQRVQGLFNKPTILDLIVRLGIAHFEAGSIELANVHFAMARKIEPKTVGPEIKLGQLYESRQEFQLARDSYRQALQINPNSLPALNNLAWLLSTVSNTELRDGQQAVKLAEKAVRMTGRRHAGLLDTLATSFAEVGRLDEAIKTAGEAIELAQKSSKFNLAGEITKRRDEFIVRRGKE